MKAIGPQKIIMINSGKYSYANISIDKATHLVGANNAGKTSLISPLQWLFIDNENSMSFPKDFSRTKKYYFKDQYSYILFECQTLDGFKVIGVRGTSRLPGDHERYIYDGVYSRQDYFNEDGSIKNGDEVKIQLSDRDYTPLTAGLLRSALTGVGLDKMTARGLNLGLLPIKDTQGYIKFRNIYHNLLDLSNVGQQELKNALLHICEASFRSKGSINLEASYNDKYVHVQKKKTKLESLRRALPHINNCITFHEERLITRSDLAVGYRKIENLFNKLKMSNSEILQKLLDDIEVKKHKIEVKESQLTEKKNDISRCTEKIGGLKERIGSFTKHQEMFKEYVPSLEVHIIDSLQKKAQDLQFKLGMIEVETLETLQKRIQRNEHDKDTLQKRLENIDKSVATALRKYFTDGEIEVFFALYNHHLLDLKVGEGDFEITNTKSIIQRMRSILKNIQNGVYTDQDISIPVDDLRLNLPEHIDTDALAEKIKSLEQEIHKDKSTLKSAEEKKELSLQHKGCEDELTTKKNRHRDYLKMVEESKAISELEKELSDTEKSLLTLQKQQKDLERDIKNVKDAQDTTKNRINALRKKESDLVEKIRTLSRPKSDWGIIDEESFIEDDLSVLVDNHTIFSNQESQLSYKYESEYIIVQQITGSSYTGSTDQATLSNLKDEIENIDRQEEALDSLWRSLMTALGTNLNYLLSDLEGLKANVTDINRDLAKIKISDLQKVELKIIPNVKITNTIATVAKQSANIGTLFSSLHIDQTADAMGQLQKLFQTRGKIEIADLFSLHFHVVRPDGTNEDYSELKDVESEGTTITIKVLVNLILLKGLFEGKQKVAIPFYLDEVGRLDEQNAKAVIRQAEALGFTPIIASPEPMAVVSRIYALRSGKEGLYVDDRNLMILAPKKETVNA